MTRGLSLRTVFSLLFQDTLLHGIVLLLLFFPFFLLIKKIYDTIEANKSVAGRCKEKVAQVEGAMAKKTLVLNL